MPAYWVARSNIIEPVAYKRYTDLVPGIIKEHGGKILARGGNFRILEGTDKFERFVVIEFPSLDAGEACFKSEEYKTAAANRRDGAGEVDIILVESA